MLILFETPAGYALFRCLNEKKLKDVDSIYKYFEDEDKAKKMFPPLLLIQGRIN